MRHSKVTSNDHSIINNCTPPLTLSRLVLAELSELRCFDFQRDYALLCIEINVLILRKYSEIASYHTYVTYKTSHVTTKLKQYHLTYTYMFRAHTTSSYYGV